MTFIILISAILLSAGYAPVRERPLRSSPRLAEPAAAVRQQQPWPPIGVN